MRVGDKLTVDKRVFNYGTGSKAIVVPAQLNVKHGEVLRVTFEKVESNGQE